MALTNAKHMLQVLTDQFYERLKIAEIKLYFSVSNK